MPKRDRNKLLARFNKRNGEQLANKQPTKNRKGKRSIIVTVEPSELGKARQAARGQRVTGHKNRKRSRLRRGQMPTPANEPITFADLEATTVAMAANQTTPTTDVVIIKADDRTA